MCHVQSVILFDVFFDGIVESFLQLSLFFLEACFFELGVLQESLLCTVIRFGLRPVNLLKLSSFKRVNLFIPVKKLKSE